MGSTSRWFGEKEYKHTWHFILFIDSLCSSRKLGKSSRHFRQACGPIIPCKFKDNTDNENSTGENSAANSGQQSCL